MSSFVFASYTTKSSPLFTIFARSANVTYVLDAVLYNRRFAYFLIVVGVGLAMSLLIHWSVAMLWQHNISVLPGARNCFLHRTRRLVDELDPERRSSRSCDCAATGRRGRDDLGGRQSDRVASEPLHKLFPIRAIALAVLARRRSPASRERKVKIPRAFRQPPYRARRRRRPARRRASGSRGSPRR